VLSVVAWAYVAGVCALATVVWGLGDSWWPATALLFIGRWIFLLPLVVLVPAAVVMSRRLLAPLAVAALVVVGPIMGARTGWHRLLSAPAGTPLRVVSFNAAGGIQLAGDFSRLLDDLAPDVVGIQECGNALAGSLSELKGWAHHEAVGLCLVSRYPIRQVSVMDRSVLEAVKRTTTNGGAGAVVRYTIDARGGPIQVTNLHLETPRKGLDRMRDLDISGLRQNTYLRDIESELARRWVDAGGSNGPVPFVVVGDFNTPVESRIFQRYWADLTDAFSRAGVGLGMTKYNGWIRVRIDHVLIGPGWHVRRALVGDDLGSDHRPAIADLTLIREPAVP